MGSELIVAKLAAGLVMLSVLVVVHEFGHFVVARIFGVGVPVFSVGMGPRLFGFHYGGTDYRVSALPVGGYVQMSGADPFGEQDVAQDVPEDEDFMRKPVWQRLIIMLAGPGVNIALPFVLFTVLLMMGRPDWNSRVGAVLPGTPAEEAGFQVMSVGTSRNLFFAALWPVFRFLPFSRKKMTSRIHWLGWSYFVILEKK